MARRSEACHSLGIVIDRHRQKADVQIRIDAVDLHLRPVPVLGHGRFTAGKGRDFRIVIRRQRILLAVLDGEVEQSHPFVEFRVANQLLRAFIHSFNECIRIFLMGERNVQQVVGQNPGLLVSVHEWRNTGACSFGRFLKLCERLRKLGDSRFFKQIFIINKSITLDRHRLSVQFTVFGHRLFGNVNNVLHPWLVREILNILEPRFKIAVSANVENVRFVAGSELRFQRRAIIRAAANRLNVQLNAGMLFFVFGFQFIQSLGDFDFKLKNLNRFVPPSAPPSAP